MLPNGCLDFWKGIGMTRDGKRERVERLLGELLIVGDEKISPFSFFEYGGQRFEERSLGEALSLERERERAAHL
jgi:hypothetical protein